MRRKIFLDIGGWNGISVSFFLKYHPNASEFEIFTFECDRSNILSIKKKNLPITLIEKAAWVHDGFVKFYPGGAMPGSGGTLYPSKITGNIDPKKYYEVPSIDLAKFMRDNFNKDDYIIMKMNCEGAEYDIIPHLKRNDLISWVNKWYVQWHYKKIKMPEAQHELIVKMIPEYYPWDCQCNAATFKTIFINSL